MAGKSDEHPKPNINWGLDWIKKDGKSLKVDLNFIAVLYIKYYWDMLYKFRLKQSPAKNQYGDEDVNIHKNFRDDNGEPIQPPKKIAELASDDYSPLRENVIYGNTDKHIKSSFGEVLFALDSYGFFKSRHPRTRTTSLRTMDPFLEYTINYMLTKYLEGINKFFPQVAKAVLIDIPRGSLHGNEKEEYDRLYRSSEFFNCFYCNQRLRVKRGEPARDHVIPFDYVLSDELYNSVPSCQSCNSTKSNRLPDKVIFDKVIERNKTLTPESRRDYLETEFRKLYRNCKESYNGNREMFHFQNRSLC